MFYSFKKVFYSLFFCSSPIFILFYIVVTILKFHIHLHLIILCKTLASFHTPTLLGKTLNSKKKRVENLNQGKCMKSERKFEKLWNFPSKSSCSFFEYGILACVFPLKYATYMKFASLIVKIIIVSSTWRLCARAGILWIICGTWEAEIVAESTRLLQCLCKHFVLADVIIWDWATGELHCLFEMCSSNIWNGIVFVHLE